MTAETLTITKQVRPKAKFIGFTFSEQIFEVGHTPLSPYVVVGGGGGGGGEIT